MAALESEAIAGLLHTWTLQHYFYRPEGTVVDIQT